MEEFERILELISKGKIEINNFVEQQKQQQKRKKMTSTRKHNFVRIEYIRKHDSIRVTCNSFCRKPVNVLITNVSKFSSISEAIMSAVQNTWGHATQLFQNHIIPNLSKIEKDLQISNFTYIKIR